MTWLTPFFTQHAESAVFLAIGLGYWIGQFNYKGVGFGPVTGVLTTFAVAKLLSIEMGHAAGMMSECLAG